MNSRYTFLPPVGGWIELKDEVTPETDPPRRCHFKDIECPELTSCSKCEHWREELL